MMYYKISHGSVTLGNNNKDLKILIFVLRIMRKLVL